MHNVDKLLDDWSQTFPRVNALIDEFLSSRGAGRRYLLGRNEHSAALANVIDVTGFVDDYCETGAVWSGKPVIKMCDVPADGMVVNCSMSISPVTAERRLKDLNIRGVLAYSDLCRVKSYRVPLPDFVFQTREDLMQNKIHWEQLRDSLADIQSLHVFDDLLKYRVTGDYRAMSHYSVRPKEQYFEDFVDLVPGEVFVDGGGFDGDTTEEFCRRCPKYRRVVLFEPSAMNCQKAQIRLRNFHSIEFVEKGLSNVPGVLCFNPDAGPASKVSETGSCQIHATTMDIHVQGKITFIKMDLEGWEMKALEGSRRHICEDHPKLAIAVYHHPSHFWRIKEMITGMRADYEIYLRHYTEGWSETVMYFIPTCVGHA